MTNLPEEKLAAKLLSIHNLTPPVNVETLIKRFAHLEYRKIPIAGIDGVSIGIKIPGKNPVVIVNSDLAPTRQKFTLAHELGHIIIPWHIGTVIGDTIDNTLFSSTDYEYREMEQEANRFAAALLMPYVWIMSNLTSVSNLSELHSRVSSVCQVSPIAAAIRLISTLGPGVVYVLEKAGEISSSGRTQGTLQKLPENETPISHFQPAAIEEYSTFKYLNQIFHWWKFPAGVQLEVNDDPRTWREILDQIAMDLQPAEGVISFKKTVNGIIANANGNVKGKLEPHDKEKIMAACLQRLSRSTMKELVNHRDFKIFLTKKVEDLATRDR